MAVNEAAEEVFVALLETPVDELCGLKVAVLPSPSPPSMACVLMLVLWKYTLLVLVHGLLTVPLNKALSLFSVVNLVKEPVQVSEYLGALVAPGMELEMTLMSLLEAPEKSAWAMLISYSSKS